MCICEICKTEFKNNLSGDLTKHLQATHNISLEEYVTKTTYNGTPPKCKCGYCTDVPSFVRGKYLSYAKKHNTDKWVQKCYTEKHGEPKCAVCGNPSGFKRKMPKPFCSHICSGKVNGFSKPSTQKTINAVIVKRYGVKTASQIPSAREKMSKAKTGTTFVMSESGKKNISDSMVLKWKKQEYKKRTSCSIKKALNMPDQREHRRNIQLDKMKNDEYRKTIIDNLCKISKKFSKLHQKIRNVLELEKHGFVSEQRVGRYLVDELNENKKIIVEINGDYVHANPLMYKSDDIIRLPGNSYTADEKWESDTKKRMALEKMGYIVITIWESDDIDIIKKKIFEL